MANSAAIAALWQRVDRALETWAPRIARSLQPPLSPNPEEADWLRHNASPAIVAHYAAHDGATRAGGILSRLPISKPNLWPRATRWLPFDDARNEHARILAMNSPQLSTERLYPLSHLHAHDFESTGNECVVVNLDTEELFTFSDVEYSRKTTRIAIGCTFAGYLEQLLGELEAGKLGAEVDEYNLLRFAERAPQTINVPRDEASVFVEVLCERNLIELSGAPSPQLISRIGKALQKRSEERRIAALRKVFEESEEVVEDYARDEELAAIIRDVCGA